MKRFLLQITIFSVIIILLDYLLIRNVNFLKFLTFIEFGFELNQIADTLHLEGVRLFIGLGTILLFGGVLTITFNFINKTGTNAYDAFVSFYNFFVVIIVLNIVGGISYFICSQIPLLQAANDFITKAFLFRIYINLPFIENFDFTNAFINFSFSNLVGLFLLKSKYFKQSLTQFATIISIIKEDNAT